VIRLGTLAGYSFEGPRVLAGFTPSPLAVVYAILYRPDPENGPQRYGVLYVGQSEDFSQERLPFRHPRAPCWLKRVGGQKYQLHICYLEAPGAKARHREQIAKELISVYKPGCNLDHYDQAWSDHWIGDYEAPTAGPLTTSRDPGPRPG
jgi:hypothetical protein